MKTEIRDDNSIWLIEHIWIDPMENSIGNAVGYQMYGYVESEDKAKEICDNGTVFTDTDCWAIYKTLPEFKYTKVELINN